jgi:hypothetical protein
VLRGTFAALAGTAPTIAAPARCWFLAPLIAIAATGCVARMVYEFSLVGLVGCLAINFGVRRVFRHRAEVHDRKYHHRAHHQSEDDVAVPEVHPAAESELALSEQDEAGVTASGIGDTETPPPQGQSEFPQEADGDSKGPTSREDDS